MERPFTRYGYFEVFLIYQIKQTSEPLFTQTGDGVEHTERKFAALEQGSGAPLFEAREQKAHQHGGEREEEQTDADDKRTYAINEIPSGPILGEAVLELPNTEADRQGTGRGDKYKMESFERHD